MKKILRKRFILEFVLLFLVMPYIAHANPIVFANLYSPFSSDIVMWNVWLNSTVFFGGLALELILIFLFIRKYINQERKKKAIIQIFIFVIILNLITMYITQGIAIFVAFFAEFFPIIIEFFIVYLIFKKANRKELLIKVPPKKSIFIIVFFANLLSFGFGLTINYIYHTCEDYYYTTGRNDFNFYEKRLDKISTRSYCFYLPCLGKEFRNAKQVLDMRKIEECEKLDIVGDNQYNCYVNYAIQNNDIKLCKFAKKEEDFESSDYYVPLPIKEGWEIVCYNDVALKTSNDGICGRIGYAKTSGDCQTKNDLMFNCYFEIAITKKDYSICDKIKDFSSSDECEWIKNMREKCYLELNNICKKNGNLKENCITIEDHLKDEAVKNLDLNICNRITNSDVFDCKKEIIKAKCYSEIATIKKDYRICLKISSNAWSGCREANRIRDNCYNSLK